MGEIDPSIVSDYLNRRVVAGNTTNQGKALEDLMCYVLGKVPGFTISYRNTVNVFLTEEVDIAIWNDLHERGIKAFPGAWLVECKNWTGRVGSDEVAYFARKLQNRRAEVGVLVALNGITGAPLELSRANYEMATALKDGARIIVLDREDLLALKHGEQLAALIKAKFCELTLTATNS
jgi:hypothetical protein